MDSTPENEYKRDLAAPKLLVQAVTKSCFTEVLEMEVYGFLEKHSARLCHVLQMKENRSLF